MTQPPAGPSRSVVVTPFGQAPQLAATLSLLSLPAIVVPAGGRSVVVPVGDTTAEAVARHLSRAVGEVPVYVLRRTDTGVVAEEWTGGVGRDYPGAGLVLSGLPDHVTGLVLGRAEATELPGALDSRTLSRRQALTLQLGAGRLQVAQRRLRWGLVAGVFGVLTVVVAVRAAAGSGSWWLVALGVVLTALGVVRAVRTGRADSPSGPQVS